ncbi:uncharacterized protein KZ484_026470 isoform 1-T2 [Pholidichthys leucotaenia]
MERSGKGQIRKKRKFSAICLLLLTFLQTSTPSAAQTNSINTSPSRTTTTTSSKPGAYGYRTQPANVTVAVGEPAVFRCGVPRSSQNISFTFYGSHGKYVLICPHGHIENIPQALYGTCEINNTELLAVWTIQGTSYFDNGTRVVCHQLKNPHRLTARLHVYDNGASNALVIGCVIGGVFGIVLVSLLLYAMLVKSDTLQNIFGAADTEDDTIQIVKE